MGRWVTNGLLAAIFLALCAIAFGFRWQPLDRTGFDNSSHWVFDRLTSRLCIVKGIGARPICKAEQFIGSYKKPTNALETQSTTKLARKLSPALAAD